MEALCNDIKDKSAPIGSSRREDLINHCRDYYVQARESASMNRTLGLRENEPNEFEGRHQSSARILSYIGGALGIAFILDMIAKHFEEQGDDPRGRFHIEYGARVGLPGYDILLRKLNERSVGLYDDRIPFDVEYGARVGLPGYDLLLEKYKNETNKDETTFRPCEDSIHRTF